MSPRSLTPALTKESTSLASPNADLLLVQVRVNPSTMLFFVKNPQAVTWNGTTYQPMAFTVNPVKADSKGSLEEVDLMISNVSRAMSGYIEANDLRGQPVWLTGMNAANLSDPNAFYFHELYEITEITVTDMEATFTLGHPRLLQQQFPSRRFLRDNCQWVYKSKECGYTDFSVTLPGTVSSLGTTVTGAGTAFTKHFQPNDTIQAAGQQVTVQSIQSDTDLTVSPAPSPAWSHADYQMGKPTCSKQLEGNNGCRAHVNVPRFGGFPAIPSTPGQFV